MERLALEGVLLFQLKRYADSRGYFMEQFQEDRYRQKGLSTRFVQDNLSLSSVGVLRGLHYQILNPQGKLVTVLQGKVFDVVVDLRKSSPTFGEWIGITLSAENGKQLWIPPGFAHGFLALTESTLFSYKCTDYYNPQGERTLIWNDPSIGIQWPIEGMVLNISEKDQKGKTLLDCEVFE